MEMNRWKGGADLHVVEFTRIDEWRKRDVDMFVHESNKNNLVFLISVVYMMVCVVVLFVFLYAVKELTSQPVPPDH